MGRKEEEGECHNDGTEITGGKIEGAFCGELCILPKMICIDLSAGQIFVAKYLMLAPSENIKYSQNKQETSDLCEKNTQIRKRKRKFPFTAVKKGKVNELEHLDHLLLVMH